MTPLESAVKIRGEEAEFLLLAGCLGDGGKGQGGTSLSCETLDRSSPSTFGVAAYLSVGMLRPELKKFLRVLPVHVVHARELTEEESSTAASWKGQKEIFSG